MTGGETQGSSYEIRLAEHFSKRIQDLYCISNLEVPEVVTVQYTQEPAYAERFPAVLDWDGNKPATLLYSHEAIRKNAAIYGDDIQIIAAMEKLYIAGSIGFGILIQNIEPEDRSKVQRVYEQLVDTTRLVGRLNDAPEFSDADKRNLNLSLLQLGDEQLLQLGVLRFVSGVYDFFGDDTELSNQLQQLASEDLLLALKTRRQYEQLANLNIWGRHADTEQVIDKLFNDMNAEMSLALRFPMDLEEMWTVISYAASDETRNNVRYNESVANDIKLGEGFHEE